MDFKNRESGIWVLGLVLALMVSGMGYLSAQTPAASPVTDFNAAGYEATPVPTHVHKHKNLMTSNKIANEGTQPGKPIDGENPTITMVPVGTVASTPNP
jgi:hypothetical protein